MKIQLNKNLRIALIIIIVVLLGISTSILYKQVKNPGFKEEKVSIDGYKNKAEIYYKVFLKPNMLYNNKSMEEGQVYITQFVDAVKTSFSYQFNAKNKANINGEYEMAAEVEGYIGEGKSHKTIWKKNFILVPKTNFDSKQKGVSIKKDIPLKLEQFNNFAKQVNEDSKIGAEVKLTVYMNVHINIKTDKGIIEKKMSPSMVIPLNKNYFEITGNLIDEKPIVETRQVALSSNEKNILFYSLTIIVLIAMLLFLLYFTNGKRVCDLLEKELKNIFKNHGDRLVALNSEISDANGQANQVRSIDDLVRVADEVGKPILYQYHSDYKKIGKFYVFDDKHLYVLDLNEGLPESETQTSNTKQSVNT